MSQKRSGRDIAVKNVQQFNRWIEEREAAKDWPDYVRAGKLNRSEIAAECGFALSVVRQNPAVKLALEALEERLRAAGTLADDSGGGSDSRHLAREATNRSVDRRLLAAKGQAEHRVKALEEQNAALRAEVRDLREQLTRYRHLDEHLGKTGRWLS